MRAAILTILLALSTITVSATALADARTEATAKAVLKKAEGDYLAMNYGTGAANIEKAMKACGQNKCSAPVRAALFRDLATMQFRKGDTDQAARNWAAAVKLQADIALNPSYDAPDLHKAFLAAAKGGGAAKGDASGAGEQPSGDFAHTPAVEQKTDTPLPIYAEGGGDNVTRVVVKYKGPGMTSWKRIDLKKVGDGWGGLVPCADVQTGSLRYYIQGLDDSKEPVANSGDARHPYTVAIKDDISGDAPHLPGMNAPKSCHESSDCPPDFPGCSKSGDSAGAEGDDNGGDESKDEGSKDAKPFKRIWVGLMGAMDFQTLPPGSDLCKLTDPGAVPDNKANVYCTNPSNGSDFPSRASNTQNSALVNGEAGRSDGGVHRGDLRLALSFDYALTANMLVGARFGGTFFKYNGQAAYTDGKAWGLADSRLYMDVRYTYLFGHEALTKTFAPLVFGGLGLASFDSHVDAGVNLNSQNGTVSLWQMNGPFFVMLGAGVRVAMTQALAGTVAIRANATFGPNGVLPVYTPEVGLAYGF